MNKLIHPVECIRIIVEEVHKQIMRVGVERLFLAISSLWGECNSLKKTKQNIKILFRNNPKQSPPFHT